MNRIHNLSKSIFVGVVMAFVTVIISIFVLLLSSAFSPVNSAPLVHWAPDTVNAIVTRNGHTEVQVSLDAVEALGNVYLRVVPEIAPYVTVNPSAINNVKPGDKISVRITVQAGATAPLEMFDGTIQVRQQTNNKPGQGKVFARPLPVTILIREEEGVAGVDADNNGVWDYVDQYINTVYPGPDVSSVRIALRQNARAIQGGVLHADDNALSIRYAEDMDRSIECVYFLRPEDARKVLLDLKANILNTKTRSEAFMMFSEQSAGHVFSSALVSQRSASCVTE
ncbi:MAG: hypothetical protein V9G98_27830 [Candidatus Competibacter sp.]